MGEEGASEEGEGDEEDTTKLIHSLVFMLSNKTHNPIIYMCYIHTYIHSIVLLQRMHESSLPWVLVQVEVPTPVPRVVHGGGTLDYCDEFDGVALAWSVRP